MLTSESRRKRKQHPFPRASVDWNPVDVFSTGLAAGRASGLKISCTNYSSWNVLSIPAILFLHRLRRPWWNGVKQDLWRGSFTGEPANAGLPWRMAGELAFWLYVFCSFPFFFVILFVLFICTVYVQFIAQMHVSNNVVESSASLGSLDEKN